MGKPPKQAKTKGNLKPASSSRAAELAASGTGSALSFQNLGGFAQFAGATAGSLITTGSDFDSFSNGLDAELVVILKKVSKRDAVTKLKALEELESYLKANTSVIPSVISSWTKIYVKLTIEVDRRVRLAANNVHKLISTEAKKKLAPHLKEFVGAWLITMFDQSPDVARAAKSSFETVFAEDKRQGVLEFCQKDILDYVKEMVLSKTPDTLSDPRHVTKEDMAAKFARVISCCVYCICYIIEKLPQAEREKYTVDYDALFDSSTLWKFASHSSPVIRKSVYRLIKTLLMQWKGMLSPRMTVICPALFTSFLSEKEAGTFSDMWDAVLLLTKEFPEAWLIAGKKKPVMPKFHTFLRGGLNGAIRIGYPSILVILANLPAEIKSGPSFYKDLFTNFWKGISCEFVDKTNSDVFVNAYAECVVYAAASESKSNPDNVTYLINDAFLGMIKAIVTMSKEYPEDKSDPKVISIIAKHLSVLASAQGVKDSMVPFWTELETLLVQPMIDCVVPRGSGLDFSGFCRTTVSLLIEIRGTLEPVEETKDTVYYTKVTDLAKRLISASLASSLVYKDKSYALLLFANEALMKYWSCLNELSRKEIVEQAKILLPLLVDGPESTLESFAAVYVDIISRISVADGAIELWNLAISKLSSIENDDSRQAKALVAFLEQLRNDDDYQSAELDSMFEKYIVSRLSAPAGVPENVLQHLGSTGLKLHLSCRLFSEQTYKAVVTSFQKKLSEFVQHKPGTSYDQPLLDGVLSVMVILENVLENRSLAREFLSSDASAGIPSDVFETIYVAPVESQDRLKMIIHAASTVWRMIATSATDEETSTLKSDLWREVAAGPGVDNKSYRSNLFMPVLSHVKRTITDVTRSESPSVVLDRLNNVINSFYTANDQGFKDAIITLLGDKKDWEALRTPFAQFTSKLLTLSITDKYIALVQAPPVEEDELMAVAYDSYGLSAYGRLLFAVAEYITQVGPDEFFEHDDYEWVMQHLMLTNVECQHGLDVPGSCRIWNSSVTGSTPVVLEFLQRTNYIFDYRFETLLVTEPGHNWYNILYSHVTNPQNTSSGLLSFVENLMRPINYEDEEVTLVNVMSGVIVETALRKLVKLVGLSSDSVSRWLGLLKAESKELKLPIKVAVLHAIKDELYQETGYKNLQSDLTSKLSGISSLQDFDDENGKAWNMTVLLNATSMDHGNAIDIPSQRLMHLVLSVRKWFDNDHTLDDFAPERRSHIVTQLTQLFINIAKSVKDVSGGQWDFFLERSYEWLAYNDSELDEELPTIYYAAQLFATLRTLAYEGIPDLLSALNDQAPSFYEALLKLFIKEGETALLGTPSKPRAKYQELLADLSGDIPAGVLFEFSTISDVATSLKATNEAIQKCALKLLEVHVSHVVQDLSVRLEFSQTSEDESETKATIEESIFENILNPPDISKWHSLPLDEQALHEVFGFMLYWLLMLEHFNNITFRLKQEYTAQLKDADAVSQLMPFISKILGVGVGHTIQPFDLTPWDIDSYEPDGFDSAHEVSYQVLAAHLYFKSLKNIPSLIRQWWVDCKNRQLTIGVESYTEKNFSAMLINNELDLVARDDIKTLLEDNDDNEFTVKALRAASEVTATYRVDEQNMQIAIKLPSNYPLRQIDVEGVQKVGVSDKQWRGWMFSVAAVIGSQVSGAGTWKGRCLTTFHYRTATSSMR
ncbi:hypothetical protein BJV82DRAFT_594115 [Fennellomyces sp. T-0311]|nr:hypothetical protein BJV82DRAFT_594115 [Fennellomyces sp. T-0311]